MSTARWLLMVVCLSCALLGAPSAMADDDEHPPSDAQIAFARTVYGLMRRELFAALLQEFNETTVDNVPHGMQAISLIFNNANRDMRLIGNVTPLLGGSNNRPRDTFEDTALVQALQGQGSEAVERINGRWYFRGSTPLQNASSLNCGLCHSAFTVEGQWVGALVQRVPIRSAE